MCGIVGGIAQRDISPILLEGLKRLEYRGYDSAGMAIIDHDSTLKRHRRVGKVAELEEALNAQQLCGPLGIAHTRWATHGIPSEDNAHPHISEQLVAVVHNGIIENYESLKTELQAQGATFTSQTDTEVIVHLISADYKKHGDLFKSVQTTIEKLEGAYAIGVVAKDKPDELITARHGSPLVIGQGIGENFIASDIQALLPVTNRFIYLENGDIAKVYRQSIDIYDQHGKAVSRDTQVSALNDAATDKGNFKHYMLKEIYEQPRAVSETLRERVGANNLLNTALPANANPLLKKLEHVQIIACGTSYHSGMVARYWFESILNVPCQVEVASEFRYRKHVTPANTLLVTISQSGETADTLAALQKSKSEGYLGSLTICNVPESSLIRESDFNLMTFAGPEIGVASTKAFTTQLCALLVLIGAIAKAKEFPKDITANIANNLRLVPSSIELALTKDQEIAKMCEDFVDKNHALFLGRGTQYPIAMEGALKLKEISYIHAEAYPAGELKHGPLALVDENMPIIAIAAKDDLIDKLRSNLEEVRARGGKLYVFANENSGIENGNGIKVIKISDTPELISPIVNVIYLQLLSYHTAVYKGTDIDQPRNLAKSVTVE